MKLRNKKTGEIMLGLELSVIEYGFGHEWMRDWSYNSIKAFLEDWEDVKENSTAEPLIKDEKIRKAVRAWAEAVGGSPVCFYEDAGYEGVGRLKIYREGYPAVFDLGHQFYDLELDTQYTIAELCGEEEE